MGDVVLRQECEKGRYEIGIVIEARHWGCGYSKQAMRLLMEVAFHRLGAKAVVNDFERSRGAALKLHLDSGFEIVREDGFLHLQLTRERYLERFG